MYPELVTRPDLKVFLPPIGGSTIYCFGDPAKLGDRNVPLACRVHDECNGSDVFGSDICTCRPYLAHGVELCIEMAQAGGVGLIVYNRKEGRALGEVTKFLVYNARKRDRRRRHAGVLFHPHRGRRRRARHALPGADARRAALARHHPYRPLRVDERHEDRRAAPRPASRIGESVPLPGRADPDRRARRDRGEARGRLSRRRGDPASTRPSIGRASANERAPRPARERPDAPPELLACAAPPRCASAAHACTTGSRRGARRISRSTRTKLDAAAALVAEVTRATYPDLAIPHHSRWRHFSAGGCDRWAALPLAGADAIERARAAIDLTFVSVLLDAGAGAAWRYRDDETGLTFARSEGLAVASFDMFRAGAVLVRSAAPLRVDATALAALDAARRSPPASRSPTAIRWSGCRSASRCCAASATALAARPDLFGAARPAGPPGRCDPGVVAGAARSRAADILALVLDGLRAIWPSGLVVDGVALGDAGRHPADPHAGPLGRARAVPQAVAVAHLFADRADRAGRRDGRSTRTASPACPSIATAACLIDTGVIVPRAPLDPTAPHEVASELIVEWRALTVALLDRLREADAPAARARVALDVATAARRHLERRPRHRGAPAPARRPAADRRQGGRDGVLSGFRNCRAPAMSVVTGSCLQLLRRHRPRKRTIQ